MHNIHRILYIWELYITKKTYELYFNVLVFGVTTNNIVQLLMFIDDCLKIIASITSTTNTTTTLQTLALIRLFLLQVC